jgi:hydrogenase maturation protease
MERTGGPALIIGIGNPLRGDDGIGPWLVTELEQELGREAGAAAPPASCRVVRQLLPELAGELAGAARVLFVDAWRAPTGSQAELAALGAAGPGPHAGGEGPGSWSFGHGFGPGELLALAALLHDTPPRADLLRIPAAQFALSVADADAGFSATVHHQLPRARRLLRRWLVNPQRPGSRSS